ncbi:hypothetical protein GCM10009677_52080 [Sphaerisporangium rubeum]
MNDRYKAHSNGNTDMASNSSNAGEMKATASQRSLSRRDPPGAGGVADAACTG